MRKFFGYFVWKITILRQKKIIFFPIAEGGAKIFGVFRVKNHDFTPKIKFLSNFRGARAGCAPPESAPVYVHCQQIWNLFVRASANRKESEHLYIFCLFTATSYIQTLVKSTHVKCRMHLTFWLDMLLGIYSAVRVRRVCFSLRRTHHTRRRYTSSSHIKQKCTYTSFKKSQFTECFINPPFPKEHKKNPNKTIMC